jgi:hypothetical protein
VQSVPATASGAAHVNRWPISTGFGQCESSTMVSCHSANAVLSILVIVVFGIFAIAQIAQTIANTVRQTSSVASEN